MLTRQLIKTALFVIPFMALYSVTTIYVFGKAEISLLWKVFPLIIPFLTIAWTLNIILATKIPYEQNIKRYFLSYFMLFFIFFCIKTLFKPEIPIDLILNLEEKFHFPLVNSAAMNTIILVIINSILLKNLATQANQKVQLLQIQNMEAKQNLLMRQFHPHFMFNALSTLKSLIKSNIEGAEHYILQLSGFLRYSIDADQDALVTLKKELNFNAEYIAMQQIRFGEALVINNHIDQSHLSKKVPVFSIQSLVENAIKHNAFSLKSPLLIELLSDEQNIIIRNNIQAKRGVESSGKGLKALNARHELLCNCPILIIQTETHFTVTLKLMN